MNTWAPCICVATFRSGGPLQGEGGPELEVECVSFAYFDERDGKVHKSKWEPLHDFFREYNRLAGTMLQIHRECYQQIRAMKSSNKHGFRVAASFPMSYWLEATRKGNTQNLFPDVKTFTKALRKLANDLEAKEAEREATAREARREKRRQRAQERGAQEEAQSSGRSSAKRQRRT
jgi:hypothetical protein